MTDEREIIESLAGRTIVTATHGSNNTDLESAILTLDDGRTITLRGGGDRLDHWLIVDQGDLAEVAIPTTAEKLQSAISSMERWASGEWTHANDRPSAPFGDRLIFADTMEAVRAAALVGAYAAAALLEAKS